MKSAYLSFELQLLSNHSPPPAPALWLRHGRCHRLVTNQSAALGNVVANIPLFSQRVRRAVKPFLQNMLSSPPYFTVFLRSSSCNLEDLGRLFFESPYPRQNGITI